MIARNSLLLVAVALVATVSAHASALAGKWTTEFDSQIGVQKYTYEFTLEDGKLVGTATFQNPMNSGEIELTNITEDGENVSFLETFSFDGNEIPITYKGTVVGDEMKLTREVADIATEQVVATRVKD
jgi:hypothetical protein